MRDFIESLILRDQAEEELFLEAVDEKLQDKAKAELERKKQKEEVEICIDDKDHKFHLKHP